MVYKITNFNKTKRGKHKLIGQIYKSKCKDITQTVNKNNQIKDSIGKCIWFSLNGKGLRSDKVYIMEEFEIYHRFT